MNKLLIDDYPIQVLPKLAKEVGLNEAIFVQQLHYWTNGKSGKLKDGKRWVYNTYKDWEENFPFWSNATIRRTIASCEKQNIIFVGNYNRAGFDKTKWYAVNYEEIEDMSKRIAQNEQTSCSKRAIGTAHNEQPNTIDYTETSSETIKDTMSSSDEHDHIPYSEIVEYLNEKTNSQFRSTTKKTQTVIKARYNEGYVIDDFKKVIDVKTADWLNNSKMNMYLRPETLFGTRFEGYLNQKVVNGGTEYNANAKIDEELGF